MNTILTDDEMPPIPKDMGRMDFDLQTLINYGRAVEAAVLAKLREQEPIAWWVTLPSGEIDWSDEPIQHKEERPLDTLIPGCGYQPLYAAPLPAVVEVPKGWKLVPVEPTPEMSAAGFLVSEAEHDPAAVYRAMLAAAPEAPAQGNCEHLRPMDKVCAPCRRYPNREPQAIPAPWREAVKVARWALEGWANHGTWVWPESALEQCKRNTTEALAALAQLDALEGG